MRVVGPLAGRLDRRELVGVDALHVGREPARSGGGACRVALELEVDLLGAGQRADEVGQEPGRHGGRAVGLDLARAPSR